MNSPERVNILLVDDNYAKLLSHEAVLESMGENLLKASSARQAFEALLKNDIALILIDVCMPELDGFELAAMIREHPRFCTISIIFVSAVLTGGPDQMRGYELGGVDYMSVPVIPELLRAKVKVFIDLYRKTRELERLNAELEQRVAARTVELKTLNEDLEQRIEERTRERETALAQLFEAQKTDAIGRLTGGVAHDFNNLLMAVMGSLDLLKKRLPADDDKGQRLLDNALQGAQRGSALTQRLLAFSRRQELKTQSLEFSDLLHGMDDLLHRAMGPGIELVREFPDVLPPILADANQLELAILNIVLNARDAMSEGGRLTISAETFFRTSRSTEMTLPPGDYLCISIEDTGTGMDEATLARATEPFFTTKGHGKGTGLGLSMVHGLAAQLGGMLRVESQLSWGTTVHLWLPIARTASVELPVDETVETPQTPPCRIMVVDDDTLVLGGIRAMLEDLGHSTLQAQSATDALEQLDGGAAVDVVITDYAMPVMTGLQLAKILHERDPELPVILATGYAEFVKDPASDTLYRMSKPFSQHELGVALAAALSSDGAPPSVCAAGS